MQNEKTLKILMLEDNPLDAELIQRMLKKDQLLFVTERVDTRDEFMEAIRRFQPDVILSDHGLPQFNSKEALKICLDERPYVPFILVTGTMSDEFAISCLREGADDYILKGNLSRLPSAIRRAVKERRLERLKREARHALRKQNRELMKVNKELDSFVYSVSHNLRGPLASVLGLLNLASQEDKDQKLESLHDMMRSSVARLDETLREILDYAKNARNEISISVVDPVELVNETFEKLSYIDSHKKVKLKLNVQAACTLGTDQQRLEVILNNLLANAILYRDENKVSHVHVTFKVTEENFILTVEDNGIGIKSDLLPLVFDMFYRATEKSSGAGLGLYISREIVKRMKGQIKITSQGDSGTIVVVTIPNNVS